MRCDSCYGITDIARKYLDENGFHYVKNDKLLIIHPDDETDQNPCNSTVYQFEKIEKNFYDGEPEYFNLYENDKNEVIREYSQVMFFNSGACEFLALEKFDFEKEEWIVIQETLWKESSVPISHYSPSMNYETGLFCRN